MDVNGLEFLLFLHNLFRLCARALTSTVRRSTELDNARRRNEEQRELLIMRCTIATTTSVYRLRSIAIERHRICAIIFRGVVGQKSDNIIQRNGSDCLIQSPSLEPFESPRFAQFIAFWSWDGRTRTRSTRNCSSKRSYNVDAEQRHGKPREVSFARFNYVETIEELDWGRSPLARELFVRATVTASPVLSSYYVVNEGTPSSKISFSLPFLSAFASCELERSLWDFLLFSIEAPQHVWLINVSDRSTAICCIHLHHL